MKTARSLIMICLLLTATALFAQTENRTLMKINIPFLFSADNHTLPAGTYYVRTVTPERSISLVCTDGKHSLVVNDMPNYAGEPSSDSRLVFQKYGDEYFLTQVWTSGDNVARNLLISKRQYEIARGSSRPTSTTVLAYGGH
jgi:hypothetical protein